MGGEFSIDTDFVHWFAGYGPKTVVGPCPHDCRHMSITNIAWGPDQEHYTLNDCSDCGCRAWMPVEVVAGKPRNLWDRAVWMEVER